ncbi:YIP1 family protein [Riemerella columbina]|uniref:YIP1 family protein n=1 Tax=Riemerella columbina TaxID=103810 RepID=UPI00036E8C67|nr:YIP1 family protein [Riemerella columbina]
MKIKTLWNSFASLSDQKLTLWSISALILFYAACLIGSIKMDGILHLTYANSWKEVFINNSLVIATTIVIFYTLGKLFNSKTRWIDIFQTIAISLIPTILMVLITSIPAIDEAIKTIADTAQNPAEIMKNTTDLLLVTIFSLAMLPLLVWNIALLFNGFRTATNTKKWFHIVLFFVILFIMNSLTQTFILS